MGKIVEAFWEKHQVWPEFCPKKVVVHGGDAYTPSCLECIIEGKLPCRPELTVTAPEPPLASGGISSSLASMAASIMNKLENQEKVTPQEQNFILVYSLTETTYRSTRDLLGLREDFNRICASLSRRTCPVCKKWFLPEGKYHYFCSEDCEEVVSLGQETGRPRAGEWRQCLYCNKWFYVRRHRILKGLGNFCSKQCFGKVRGCPEGMTIEEFAQERRQKKKIGGSNPPTFFS